MCLDGGPALLCVEEVRWGSWQRASVPCLREQLAAAGGCSEAGFGGRQAAISASAALHQGCWAPRQAQVW